MMNLFKRVNWKTFTVFFIIFSLLNCVTIPLINNEKITLPRIVIGVVVSAIVAFICSLTKKPEVDK